MPALQRFLMVSTVSATVALLTHETHAKTEFVLVMFAEPYNRQDTCLLCHIDTSGGPGTAVLPFAKTLIDRGIGAQSDQDDLREVLEALGDTDSDEDGIPDLAELESGGNPNRGGCGKGSRQLQNYEYGCANLTGKRPSPPWLPSSAPLGAVLAWLGLRRVRARS